MPLESVMPQRFEVPVLLEDDAQAGHLANNDPQRPGELVGDCMPAEETSLDEPVRKALERGVLWTTTDHMGEFRYTLPKLTFGQIELHQVVSTELSTFCRSWLKEHGGSYALTQ